MQLNGSWISHTPTLVEQESKGMKAYQKPGCLANTVWDSHMSQGCQLPVGGALGVGPSEG